MKKHLLLIIITVFLFTALHAAETSNPANGNNANRPAGNDQRNNPQNRENTGQNANAATQNNRVLARGYRGVELSMQMDKVSEILRRDRLLEVDIRTDFGDLDEEPYHVIKARNVPYITSVYYQFGTTQSVKKQLFAIVIHFNSRYNDFHSILNKMKKKYRDPELLTPNTAVWSDGKTKIIVNAPSTVKYIDINLYRIMQREYAYMRHRYFPPTDEAANNELTNDL